MEVIPPETSPIVKPKIFAGIQKNKRYVATASFLALLFWFIQFIYQHQFLAVSIESSLVRSFALTGATLISIALIIGPLARLTKYNFVVHRRTFGVWGFTFILVHIIAVFYYIFNFDIGAVFFTLNPYMNPVIFGVLAVILFVPLYLTSTDWAVRKLGFRKWKGIHRLVYFAYIFAILHYTQINPPLLKNPAGYLLVAVTIIALVTQLAAFIKTVSKTKSKKAALAGIIIILIAALLFYWAFF